jgi:hypothetical protein
MEKETLDNGVKAHQRTDFEDRAREYREWHRMALSGRFTMYDVDAIEWRGLDGQAVAVGVFELTRVDGEREVTLPYLQAIIERFFERDSLQGQVAIIVARELKTKAYISLYRQGCSEFWVYCLSDGPDQRWTHYRNQDSYATFIRGL